MRSSGLALAPFHAVRFDPDRVSGLADVTSPPYDVIGPGVVARLLAAEPHNIVRLILPGAGSPQPPRGPAASALAAAQLRDWLGSGVLRPDPSPALYVYEQSVPDGDGRMGGPSCSAAWSGRCAWSRRGRRPYCRMKT